MKQSKLIIILLIATMLGGWSVVLLDTDSEEKEEYEQHIGTADEYFERGLYQKAIEEYDAALQIKNTEELWTKKLEAYEKYYAENTKIYSEYLNAAQTAVSYYDENVDYILELVSLYLIRDEYSSAYKVLENVVADGMDDERVSDLLLDVKYAYEIKWKAYTGYRTCVNGFYAVSETGVWTYIEEDQTDTDLGQLVLAGPVGESGIRVVQDEVRGYLIDSEEVLQGILDFEPLDAGVFSEGLVPIQNSEGYSYYNLLGDKQFGTYIQAGTFINGQAAVKQGEDWFLIDENGERISKETYEDIVLNKDGSHVKNGVMIAKKNGIYSFYKDGKIIGNFSDVDIITDDNMVAVCVDGKWGYVDLDGNELIAPSYIEAKSFSNGLAAVSNGEYWGFINTDGTLVIDYTFYGADYFNSKNCCMVETGKNTTWQLISLYIEQ